MIKLVLEKYVKQLNDLSLSTDEQSALRKDMLAKTGLPAIPMWPAVKSYFRIASSKVPTRYNLTLANERHDGKDEFKVGRDVRAVIKDLILRIDLNVFDTMALAAIKISKL